MTANTIIIVLNTIKSSVGRTATVMCVDIMQQIHPTAPGKGVLLHIPSNQNIPKN